MTTIKLRFRPSSIAGKEGTLYYQIIRLRKVAMISTGFHIFPHEWDEKCSEIVAEEGPESDDVRRAALRLYRSKTSWKMERMRRLAIEKERAEGGCTFEDLLAVFRTMPPCVSVFGYICSQIERKTRMHCYGTAKTYDNVLRSYGKFRNGNDLTFKDMTEEMMQEYEAWMLHNGLKRSSSSCYMRTLRTLYRQAVEDGLADDCDIFRKVRVSVGKTRKRAVTPYVIQAILALDLTGRPSLDFARDIFMFSFYTRGMSFVDIAYLKKSNLRNGFLTYNRRKTFQSLTIEWERPMQEIVNRYVRQTAGSPYMFPIVSGDAFAGHQTYEQALQRINRSLKRIGGMIGLSVPLTTYVARHSWASIARNLDVPLSVISEGLGHDSDKTTQIYLASLDTSMINRANKKIIKKVIRKGDV